MSIKHVNKPCENKVKIPVQEVLVFLFNKVSRVMNYKKALKVFYYTANGTV